MTSSCACCLHFRQNKHGFGCPNYSACRAGRKFPLLWRYSRDTKDNYDNWVRKQWRAKLGLDSS